MDWYHPAPLTAFQVCHLLSVLENDIPFFYKLQFGLIFVNMCVLSLIENTKQTRNTITCRSKSVFVLSSHVDPFGDRNDDRESFLLLELLNICIYWPIAYCLCLCLCLLAFAYVNAIGRAYGMDVGKCK